MSAAARFTGALGTIAQLLLAAPDCQIGSIWIHEGSSIGGVLETAEDARAWHATLPASQLRSYTTAAGSVHHTVSTSEFGLPVHLTAITNAPTGPATVPTAQAVPA